MIVPDYFDIEDILADQQSLPVQFPTAIPGYGHLEHASSTLLAASERVSLPYWMASTLVRNGLANLTSLPPCFQQRMRNDFLADPRNVVLSKYSPYYFAFGAKVLGLVVDEALAGILLDAFKQRMLLLFDYTQSGRQRTDRSVFLQTLDETERALYRVGYESEFQLSRWARGPRLLEAAPIIQKSFGASVQS